MYPLEIVTVICKHPNVVEAGVFGQPEPKVQELVTAFVVKNGNVSEKEIIDLVASEVDDAKQLRGGVIFVDNLPKNSVGKIQRQRLLELFNNMKFNQKIL